LVASRDKKTIFIADAKTKAARKFYPDTGIDLRHYQEYKYISDRYKIDVFIFFIDEESAKIYGNYLRVLEGKKTITHNGKVLDYPITHGGIIYFPLCVMEQVAIIPAQTALAIRQYTTKNEAYK